MDSLELTPVRRAAGSVRLPGSKSISNRVLLLAALAQGETEVGGLLDADDTRVMRDALGMLGVQFSGSRVHGIGGPFPVKKAELFLGNAGTAFRPLTAALAFSQGEYRLSGVPRMHERPIGDLVDALRGIGARIDYAGKQGFPPLVVHPAPLRVETVKVRGDVSSQFLTALLMALPLGGKRSTIEVQGEQSDEHRKRAGRDPCAVQPDPVLAQLYRQRYGGERQHEPDEEQRDAIGDDRRQHDQGHQHQHTELL